MRSTGAPLVGALSCLLTFAQAGWAKTVSDTLPPSDATLVQQRARSRLAGDLAALETYRPGYRF